MCSSPCLLPRFCVGCCGGGGGGGGGECECERSAVPYTATVRHVYQPRKTRPSVFTYTHTHADAHTHKYAQQGRDINVHALCKYCVIAIVIASFLARLHVSHLSVFFLSVLTFIPTPPISQHALPHLLDQAHPLTGTRKRHECREH